MPVCHINANDVDPSFYQLLATVQVFFLNSNGRPNQQIPLLGSIYNLVIIYPLQILPANHSLDSVLVVYDWNLLYFIHYQLLHNIAFVVMIMIDCHLDIFSFGHQIRNFLTREGFQNVSLGHDSQKLFVFEVMVLNDILVS